MVEMIEKMKLKKRGIRVSIWASRKRAQVICSLRLADFE
jgi:hypothetical protein